MAVECLVVSVLAWCQGGQPSQEREGRRNINLIMTGHILCRGDGERERRGQRLPNKALYHTNGGSSRLPLFSLERKKVYHVLQFPSTECEISLYGVFF